MKYSKLSRKQKGGFKDVLRACLSNKTSLLDQDRLTPERINERDSDGNTPLMKASVFSDPTIASLLIENGADVNAANKEGKTALMIAARSSPHIIRLLLDNGADVNAKTRSGFTPLMFAAGEKRPDIVELLINSGADPKIENKYGDTAISLLPPYIDEKDRKNREHIKNFININEIVKKTVERQKDRKHFDETMKDFEHKHEVMQYLGGRRKTRKSKKSTKRKTHRRK